VPEVELDFPRHWVEFADPDNPDVVLFRCDLTWLTSNWTCIYGNGCKGIFKEEPDAGCCTLGAHFSDAEDKVRVSEAVKRLSPEDWEHHAAGRGKRWLERDDEGVWKTRVVSGACIFSNSATFEGGMGCAFHALARREGVPALEVKPDVCWQLPISRTYERVTRDDGTEVLIVSVTEFSRRQWGAGGHALDWYCSGNTEAHVARVPVYESMREELVELMGASAYEVLSEHCRTREAVIAAARRPRPVGRHGGEPAFIDIRSLAIHPADPR